MATAALMRIGGRMVRELRASHLQEARKRAKRGAKLLDKKRPGWWRRVKLTTLNLGDLCMCVLGQAFSADAAGMAFYTGFDAGLSVVGVADRDAVLRGFDEGYSDEPDEPNFDELQAAWVDEIRTRRKQAKG